MPDKWKDTTELARLQVLAHAVRELREELVAYRWIVERWLRRGRRAVIALGLLVVLTTVAAGASLWAVRTADQAVTELRESEVRHRERNELLHGCLVDLVLAIVQTSPEDRDELENPCPPPIDPSAPDGG